MIFVQRPQPWSCASIKKVCDFRPKTAARSCASIKKVRDFSHGPRPWSCASIKKVCDFRPKTAAIELCLYKEGS